MVSITLFENKADVSFGCSSASVADPASWAVLAFGPLSPFSRKNKEMPEKDGMLENAHI